MMLSQDSYRSNVLLSPTKESIPSALHPLIHKSFLTAINKSASSTFTIALSGGSLPSFLSSLSESFINAKIDPQWDRWHVILADERLVPSTDEDSNIRAIRHFFLDKVPIPSNQIYGIDESLLSSSSSTTTNVSDVAAEYKKRVLEPLISSQETSNTGDEDGTKTVLDCVLLGFGPDGHTCSLFPDHELLNERNLLVAGIEDSPKPPPQRITLTFSVLNELSRDVIFVGTGESKMPILEATFKSTTGTVKNGEGDDECLKYEVTLVDPPVYPCGMVRPKNGTLSWVVDAAAAQDLSVFNPRCHCSLL